METIDDRTLKQKWIDFKCKAGEKKDRFVNYCKENTETVVGITIIALPIVGKMFTSAMRSYRDYKDDRKRATDYYDPRTGEHWYTRKPLTANQKLNLEQRYNNGESKGQILRSMGLL